MVSLAVLVEVVTLVDPVDGQAAVVVQVVLALDLVEVETANQVAAVAAF